MKNWQFMLTISSLAIGIICVIWGILMSVMANDLREKTELQEQEIIQYKWELEQVRYICERE